MLTAKIKPVQFIKINDAVKVSINNFLYDLKIKKNSFVLLKDIKIKDNKRKDHNPLCIATSTGGTYLISLKINGWGIPQNIDAIQV